MKKVLTSLIVLGVILVVGMVAYFSFTHLSEPLYKDHITHLVEKHTDRKLNIHGKLNIDLGWYPTITMHDVSLSNAPWSKQAQMLQAKQVSLKIVLRSLLHRELETKRVTIDEADILLEINHQGESNWPILKKTDDDKLPIILQKFPVIEINHSNLQYRNLKSQREEQLAIESLSMDYNKRSKQLELQLNAKYHQYPLQAHINIDALDNKGRRLAMKGTLAGTEFAITGTIKPKSKQQWLNMNVAIKGNNAVLLQHWLGIQMTKNDDYNLKTQLIATADRYCFNKLKLRINQNQLQGNFTYIAGKTPTYSGQLSINSNNARQFFKSLCINNKLSGICPLLAPKHRGKQD